MSYLDFRVKTSRLFAVISCLVRLVISVSQTWRFCLFDRDFSIDLLLRYISSQFLIQFYGLHFRTYPAMFFLLCGHDFWSQSYDIRLISYLFFFNPSISSVAIEFDGLICVPKKRDFVFNCLVKFCSRLSYLTLEETCF